MRSSNYDQNMPPLQIDENEVNKFYRERELMKNKMSSAFNTKKDDKEAQPPFINLFRRKSLANKLKEESGIFNNLDDSLEIDKPNISEISMNESSMSRLKYSLESLNETPKDRFSQSFTKKFNYFQVPNETFETRETEYLTPEATERENKKRSNSVQIENSSCPIRYQSRKSLENQKSLKETVPLSSILRKYQEEVNKIQHEGLNLNEDRNIFKKPQKSAIFKNALNTEDFNDSELHKNTAREDKISAGQENLSENEHIKLPEVVEQCIDKWKKLEIEQLKAEMKQSKENIENDHKPEKDSSKKSEKDLIEKIKLEYEQKFKEQQEKIQFLEKENCQFKKFAASIQKMKQTLEKIEHEDIKTQRGGDIDEAEHQSKRINKKDCPVECENDLNLKELWRWIKTLPGSKTSHKPKKSSFRC